MYLDIISPSNKIFSGDIISVKVPGSNGEFEIFKNHAPIISNLDKGTIRVTNSNKKSETYDINGGVIEMQNNKIIILVD